MAKKQYPVGQIVDAMYRARERERELNKEVKAVKAKRAEYEEMLKQAMNDQKATKLSGTLASASKSIQIVPTANDWEKIDKFILRHKCPEILHRRLATKPWRELRQERGQEIPGIEPFEKVVINLRKLGD